jgi:4-amino-4-deoxy-L-arabinose transferase-like glycosyltransferase
LVAGHLSQRLTWLWAALVIGAFGLPLFVGLGATDLQNDEAIYSFAVDRMLEDGEWLVPKSSPNEDWAFLEKPPLKFWLVAAPIRLGLLPHDEFGLRFVDACLGALAFVYVFAIGRRLAGPVCGAIAVLILFVHQPLLFDHGIRSNNMDAALLLAYCGGVFHFLAWTGAGARRHAPAVAAYFVLGFMTKFVAALFLPMVLGAVVLGTRSARDKLVRERRIWLGAAGAALAVILPWFIFVTVEFGSFWWEMMLGDHVYKRFTAYVDPTHLQPWHFYFTSAYDLLKASGAHWLVLPGLVLLAFEAVRRRSAAGATVLLWFAVPVVLISFGTSKLYHYLYPFLPPLALAGGYAPARLLTLAAPRLERLTAGFDRSHERGGWRFLDMFRVGSVQGVLVALAIGALLVAAATAAFGPIRIGPPGQRYFQNSGLVRPLGAAILLAALAGRLGLFARLALQLLVLAALPLSAYAGTLAQLPAERHPIRTLRDCLADVRARTGAGEPGVYNYLADREIFHPNYYYFRRLRPWHRADRASDPGLYSRLYLIDEKRPILISDERYREFKERLQMKTPDFVAEVARVNGLDPDAVRARASEAAPALAALRDMLVLLPGEYAACADREDVAQRPR